MPQDEQSREIISEIFQEMSQESLPDIQSNDSETEKPPHKNDEIKQTLRRNKNKHSKAEEKRKLPTIQELTRMKQSQNLGERKILLKILAVLLGIQLLFMNFVVLLIVIWCLFDFKIFRDINVEILDYTLTFMQYYITAVLVELLSGIVYMIHRVFHD